ncbi:hypothetical protein A2714_04955 [Candidatus Woesebacteria bacterium RIFCSPHIGHO2_01_FULL_38_9]|uniref:Peptidase M50 domain-containing protein n=2 Tax=Candidatus Woeseibacteriota TaxID=1752722 RepID=A0A1F7Y000_9BACT|nr:MAG: hypothetical protein A2714_04955 [Candidatus Woesebacteria bacterium RIFCSPHIGHO2_01_FULL_38_9]OGM59737.1 MAG: hypothetical protein A3A75_02180 [Candidatus Woesebacteria bacterium RIFCSPLOWO2_01_FULL_39_10]
MSIIAWILAFIIAITIHEAAHAWMADRLGDPTARLMGRLSLNPLVHYDPVGTSLLIFLIVMRELTQNPGIIPFGWAKPVQFDPYNLKNPRRDSALISLAGPLANLFVAVVASLLIHLFLDIPFLAIVLSAVIILNVVLAIFNFIPIHPLDGGKIFIGLLPEKDAYEADLFLRRWGILILFFLIFPTFGGTSPLFLVISPVIRFMLNLLLPETTFI